MTTQVRIEGDVLPDVGDLYEAVLERTNGKVESLLIEIQDGVFVLFGETTAYYFKQLAQQAAMERAGSASVSNRIEVR